MVAERESERKSGITLSRRASSIYRHMIAMLSQLFSSSFFFLARSSSCEPVSKPELHFSSLLACSGRDVERVYLDGASDARLCAEGIASHRITSGHVEPSRAEDRAQPLHSFDTFMARYFNKLLRHSRWEFELRPTLNRLSFKRECNYLCALSAPNEKLIEGEGRSAPLP